MKKRLSLGLGLPITIGLLALGNAMHTPNHLYASASTPPPPPGTVPTAIGGPPGPPTPSPTATVPAPTATNTAPAPTATTAPGAPTATTKPAVAPTTVPTPATTPSTGGGGTFNFGSGPGNAGKLAAGAAHPSQLPKAGGGSGNNPSSPLAPLALLAAIAIGAGRLMPRLLNR